MKTLKIIKTSITIFVLVLFFLLVGAQCEKDDVPQTQIAKLPPATHTGADTFGCLVDGKAFLPRKKGLFSGPVLQAQYQYLTQNGQTGNYFALTASDQKTYADEIRGVSLSAQCVDIEEKTYILDEHKTLFKLAGEYHILDESLKFNTFTTSLINTGELTITRFDDLNQIISGNFWFDAVNDKGEKVEVREGRFDMHFIK